MFDDSTGTIIRQYLIVQDLVTKPDDGLSWPGFISKLPDSDHVDTNIISFYDFTPRNDGRLMSGKVIEHPSVQIRCRASSYSVGWQKLSSIANSLELVNNTSILIPDVVQSPRSYNLQVVSRTSGILHMGADERNREHFSLNVSCTIQQI